jgi:hypothetical protein
LMRLKIFKANKMNNMIKFLFYVKFLGNIMDSLKMRNNKYKLMNKYKISGK